MDLGAFIFKDGDEFEVWVGPAEDMAWRPDPNIINGFIAGIGATRDEAVASAVRELESLTELLQSPAGVVFEQDGNAPRPAKPRKERPFPQGVVTNLAALPVMPAFEFKPFFHDLLAQVAQSWFAVLVLMIAVLTFAGARTFYVHTRAARKREEDREASLRKAATDYSARARRPLW